MASIAELSADNPALALQAAILARPATPERPLADAIRALAIDAVEDSQLRPPRHAHGHGRRRHRAVDPLS